MSISSFEQLQSIIRDVQNRIVREEFNDVDDSSQQQLGTPRGALKRACLIEDRDNATNVLQKLFLYYFCLRKAQDLQVPIYGIPTDVFQQDVKFRPQIKLHFAEDASDVEEGYRAVRATIGFRLFNETYNSISPAEAQSYAQRVNQAFARAGGFRWRKGRVKISYRRPDQGYNLVLSVFSEPEAREVLNKVLAIQSHAIDNEFLTISQLAENPPIVPRSENIYGKLRRLPRKRPVAYVRFQYAELHIWGIPKPIILVDRTGRREALIEA